MRTLASVQNCGLDFGLSLCGNRQVTGYGNRAFRSITVLIICEHTHRARRFVQRLVLVEATKCLKWNTCTFSYLQCLISYNHNQL